jgi:hypothetical protein
MKKGDKPPPTPPPSGGTTVIKGDKNKGEKRTK